MQVGVSMSSVLKNERARGSEAPRLLSIKQAVFELGIGRSALYELISAGTLKTIKIGRRRLIAREAIEDFIAALSA
jgi:excisionase family DNA binding protein